MDRGRLPMTHAHIGWWNTSLSPPGIARVSKAVEPSRWQLACEVFRQILIERTPLDILALGEVTEDDVLGLLAHVNATQRFGRQIDRRRNLALLYDTRRVTTGP